MARQKRSPATPPTSWAASLEENRHVLHSVRLLWRRGGAPYRPIVAEHLDLEQLSEQDWIEYELPETHFLWDLGPTESPADRRNRIAAIVEKLWAIAIAWTQARGESWYDFQLVGYDEEGETLFEDGRRCRIEDDPEVIEAEYEPPPGQSNGSRSNGSPPTRHRDQRPPTISAEWRELHRAHKAALEEIIGLTKTDRDGAVERERSMLDGYHRLLDGYHRIWAQAQDASQHANQVLRDTVAYQAEQVQQAKDQNSGRIKLQAHALSEMERTIRFGNLLDYLKYTWDSAMANVVPVVKDVANNMSNPHARNLPEFKWAQQAMVYLVIDLTSTQLKLLFNNNDKAAGAFLGRLDEAAAKRIEREALEHVAPLVRVLRSERFRDLAQPEQQLAARFIINRLAMYKMVEFGEDESEERSQGS